MDLRPGHEWRAIAEKLRAPADKPAFCAGRGVESMLLARGVMKQPVGCPVAVIPVLAVAFAACGGKSSHPDGGTAGAAGGAAGSGAIGRGGNGGTKGGTAGSVGAGGSGGATGAAGG